MRRFSPQLTRLLVIRGLARAMLPIAVLWGIWDWWQVGWLPAAVFTALAFNYVIVYALNWIAAPLAEAGPWRVRPWQTWVLVLNGFVLPVVYYRVHGAVPWGFVLVTILLFVGLYVGMAIMFYFYRRMPMAGIFAAQKNPAIARLMNAQPAPTPVAPGDALG